MINDIAQLCHPCALPQEVVHRLLLVSSVMNFITAHELMKLHRQFEIFEAWRVFEIGQHKHALSTGLLFHLTAAREEIYHINVLKNIISSLDTRLK